MRHILFEDHNFARLQPLGDSVPTWEIRCGLFNTRERITLVAGQPGGDVLGRSVLVPLLTAPGWSPPSRPSSDRSLWWSGRLAPNGELIGRLEAQGDRDWALQDEYGLLAAAVPPEVGFELAASWQAWERMAWSGAPWEVPLSVRSLPPPDLPRPEPTLELGWTWDIVPATAAAITGDLSLLGTQALARHPLGIRSQGDGSWTTPASLAMAEPAHVHICGAGGLYLGSGGVELAPGTQIDTTGGPVVLDSGVKVGPHVLLEGPLYLGRECRVKAGCRVAGESSFGIGNRLAGEIGESTFGDFSNKQHDGFIGHAVLGSWINLGAMTTCSDLKNNYGNVRVDLGGGSRDTGRRFVGLLMGDHAKTAIGTLFNTGTVVGFASNIFGGAMPPKHVPAFRWGGAGDGPVYDGAKARGTAEIVLGRRGCLWTAAHDTLFAFLASRAGA